MNLGCCGLVDSICLLLVYGLWLLNHILVFVKFRSELP